MTPVGTFKQVPQNNCDQNGKASSGKCGQHESKNRKFQQRNGWSQIEMLEV